MITANLFFNRTDMRKAPIPNWDAWRLTALLPKLALHRIKEQGYDKTSPPLKAFVNHGNWLVQCECGGAEKVWEEGWMMCMSCLNAAHGHKYRRTVFPKARKRIEALLMMRPVSNRNWYPGETISTLEGENEQHKAELLEVC